MTTVPYDLGTPGRKDFSYTGIDDTDYGVVAAPAMDLLLTCICQSLVLDDQDVAPLLGALGDVRGGQGSSFESCYDAGSEVREITTTINEGWVKVSDGDDFVTIPFPDLGGVIGVLIDAHQYAIAGPCPWCEVSVADHPCNGCAEE